MYMRKFEKRFFSKFKIKKKKTVFQKRDFHYFAKVLKFSGIFSKNLVPLESSHP